MPAPERPNPITALRLLSSVLLLPGGSLFGLRSAQSLAQGQALAQAPPSESRPARDYLTALLSFLQRHIGDPP